MSIVEGASAHVPEGWFEVRGAGFRGVVEGDPGSTLADECRAAEDLDALLDALTAGGLRRTPAFAVVADGSEGEPARALARGSAYVAWSGPDAGRVTAPARGPWSDEDLPDGVAGLELRGPDTPAVVPAAEPAETIAESAAEPVVDELPATPMDEPMDEPADEQTDGHVEEPADALAEEPVGQQDEHRDEHHAGAPADAVVLAPTQAMSLDELEAAREAASTEDSASDGPTDSGTDSATDAGHESDGPALDGAALDGSVSDGPAPDPEADQSQLSMDAPSEQAPPPPAGPWGGPGTSPALGDRPVPDQGVGIAELAPQVGVAELPTHAALFGSEGHWPEAPGRGARVEIGHVPFHRASGLEPPAPSSHPAPPPSATPPPPAAPSAAPSPPPEPRYEPATPAPFAPPPPPGQAGPPPQGPTPPQTPSAPHTPPAPYPPSGQAPPPPPAAAAPASATGRTALSVRCPAGHLGPPYEATCRTCGQDIPAQQPFPVPQPTVGVLRLSTGEVVTLDRDVLLGRNPRPEGDPALPRHLVRVPSPEKDVSRTHLEVALEGWHVIARDLGSTNGTTHAAPGQPPTRMRPREEQVLRPGSVLVMAGEVSVTFEAAGPQSR